MKLEYSLYDIALNDNEYKDCLTQAIKYNIDIISVLPSYVKVAKALVPTNIKISSAIDYPLGCSDLKTRLTSVEQSIKNGASVIEMVAPPVPLSNRKYDRFRDDVKNILELCSSHTNIEVRYFLEYRVFSYDLLYKIAQILHGYGIKNILPSTGYLLDDINDNILASVMIRRKVADMNIICNGNIWNRNQVNAIRKADMYAVRLNSINALSLFS